MKTLLSGLSFLSSSPTRSGKRRRFAWASPNLILSAALAVGCASGCGHQDQQAEQLVRSALKQQEAGQTADAVKTLNRSIALDGDLAEAFYLRGSCQAALGNNEEAQRDLQRANTLRPDWDRPWWALGVLHRTLNQNDRAITCLNQSVKLNPDSLDAQFDLACAHMNLGQVDEAIQHLNACRELDPKHIPTLMKLASIEIDRSPQSAITTLSRVLELDRTNSAAWGQRALAQERCDQTERALADFAVACRLHPESSLAWYHRGRLLSKLERFQEAITSLQTAKKLSPEDFQIQHQLSVAELNWKNQQTAGSAVADASAKPEAPRKDDSTGYLLFPEDLKNADLSSTGAEEFVAEVQPEPAEEAIEIVSKEAAQPQPPTQESQLVVKKEVNPAEELPLFDFDELPADEAAEALTAEAEQPVSADPVAEENPFFAEFTEEAFALTQSTPADATDKGTDTTVLSIPDDAEQTDSSAPEVSDSEEIMAGQQPAPLQQPTTSLVEVIESEQESNTASQEVAENSPDDTPFSPFDLLQTQPKELADRVVMPAPAPLQPLRVSDESDSAVVAPEPKAKTDSAVVVLDELGPGLPAPPMMTDDELDSLYQQALSAYRDGDVETCQAKLTILLQNKPSHAEGRLRMASLLQDHGQLQEALGHCNQLLTDQGLSIKAILLKGSIQRAMQQPQEAIATYTQLIESEIPSPQAVKERADVYLETEDYAAAIKDLSILIDADRLKAESLEKRAHAYEATRQWGMAVADWTSIGRIDGTNMKALEHRADAFAHMGETRPAIADLRNLLRMEPERLDVLQKLCDLNASIGRWDTVHLLTTNSIQSDRVNDEIWFLKALAASELGRPEESIQALSEALKLNAKHQPARVRRAELLLEQRNYEASLAEWNRAIEDFGVSANLLAGRATTLAAMGNRTKAVADVDNAIRIEPKNVAARKVRSQLMEQSGEFTAAISEAMEIQRLEPTKPEGFELTASTLFRRGRFQEAANVLEQAIEASPNNAELLWQRAQCRLRLNQNELAAQDLDRLLSATPRHREALKERAILKQDAGAYESAVSDLNLALEIAPNDVDAILQRGVLRHRIGQYGDAVSDLSQVVSLQPARHEARYRRGLALQQLGDPGAALADLEEALKADPNNADYLYSRGNLFASQSVNGRAMEDYAQAVAIRPNHAAAWYNYGNMLFPAGEVERAIECWNRAIEIQPDLFRAYNNRAAAHAKREQFDKAIQDYQKTIELNPDYAHAYDNYAWLLATTEDRNIRNPEEAIRLSKKACELTDYKDWAYLSTLAAAYAEAGQFDQARQWVVRSHELAPVKQKDRLIRLVKTYENQIQRGTAQKGDDSPGRRIRL